MSTVLQLARKGFFVLALYAAFAGFAFYLHGHLADGGIDEVWGWDYTTFVRQINDWKWIGYFGFRHPGLGIISFPLVVLQHIWDGAYLLVMPAVATVTAYLIWRMAGWVALVVWLSFPTTWLMAGVPESFPLAQLALISGVWILERGKFRSSLWMLGGVCVINGMITLTNGLKPLVAYIVSCGDRKQVRRILWCAVSAVALGVAVFGMRAWMTGRGVGAGVEATLSWIPANRDFICEALGFFVRPVGVLQSCVIYPLVMWSAVLLIRNRDFTLCESLCRCSPLMF